MKQTLFETRQRAEEFMKDAAKVWLQSNQSEHLEGLEEDPAFSLFMTALAYQANEVDSDIEQLKTETLSEFARMLVPYDLGHALPATAVISASLSTAIASQELDAQSVFTLADSAFRFIPLLKTTVFNCETKSVERLDARCWKVTLAFRAPISNLSGMSFLIRNPMFNDVKVSVRGHSLPLIKPWEYANLPLSDCFSLDTMLYNRSLVYQASSVWFDLFARQNIRLFYVDSHDASAFIPFETDTLVLHFEFSGIQDNFLFDRTQIVFNCLPLVNVEVHSVTLSATSPIARIAGTGKVPGDEESGKQQFLHLVPPSDIQIYKEEPITVRRVAADRFNLGSLLKLSNCLFNKYTSDFYAFQSLLNLRNGKAIYQLYDSLKSIVDEVNRMSESAPAGIYVMLKNYPYLRDKNISLEIRYLTTSGSQVNASLNSKSLFNVPPGLEPAGSLIVAEPILGADEVQGLDAETCLARYYMITNDRLVTPADIKIFCYKELMTRYGISEDMVKHIKVWNRRNAGRWHCGYEIIVDILLIDNSFIKRNFIEKIPQVELLLQKMIEVRSTNIFPVQINLRAVE